MRWIQQHINDVDDALCRECEEIHAGISERDQVPYLIHVMIAVGNATNSIQGMLSTFCRLDTHVCVRSRLNRCICRVEFLELDHVIAHVVVKEIVHLRSFPGQRSVVIEETTGHLFQSSVRWCKESEWSVNRRIECEIQTCGHKIRNLETRSSDYSQRRKTSSPSHPHTLKLFDPGHKCC